MKKNINAVVIAVAVLVAQWSLAQTITDNFTDASAWGSVISQASGSIAISNGCMAYVSSTTNKALAAMSRNLPPLSVTNDWSLKVDAHLDAFALVVTDQWSDVFLGFGKASDVVNNHVTLGFGRGWWANGYEIEDGVGIGGTNAPELFIVRGFTSADVSLRLDYSAASQTVTYYFDSDGATNGYNWVAEGTASLASGTYNMNLSATDTFTLFLGASSENQTVTSKQAYFTYLRITTNAVPTVVTGTATNVNDVAATVTGTVNPKGLATTAQFQYGLTTAYGNSVNVVLSPSNGVVAQTVSRALTGLLSSTTYHYRIVAFSDAGADLGNDAAFSTMTPMTDFTSVTNDGAITITGYIGSGGAITIPSTNNGLPVTSIGDYAFSYCSRLKSVIIPSSVTSIGFSAFSYCYNLTNITVNAANPSYTSVGGVLFDKTLTMLIQYPIGLAGSYAIPSSVTDIDYYAFSSCSGLTSVIIPSSVTNFSISAFSYCYNLTNIAVNAANPNYASANGVLFDKTLTMLIQFPGGLAGSYAIPSSVTSIGDAAFASCSGLTNVIIADNVTTIGSAAFAYCYSLKSVTIGSNVTTIGIGAFNGCSRLTNLIVNAANPSYTSVGGVLFDKTLTMLIKYPGGLAGRYAIPNSVTQIGNYAFDSCSGLTDVVIANSVTSIGGYAFAYCSGFTNVAIPDSVTSIGSYAFEYCSGLHQAYFQGNAPLVNNGTGSADSTVFYGDSGTVYYVPGTIGWSADFGGWPTVPWTAFYYKIIGLSGNLAFGNVVAGGTATTSLIITNSGNTTLMVSNINYPTGFSGAWSGIIPPQRSQSVTVTFSSVSAQNYGGNILVASDATAGTNTLAVSGTGYTPLSNFCYVTNSGTITITCYTGPDGNVIIPGSIHGYPVTAIGNNAFSSRFHLTSVGVPSSVTSIGAYAFESCWSLTNVMIPNSVISIGDWAFHACFGLTNVVLGNGVTSIGNGVFADCSGLTSVTLGNNVTSIASGAFGYCSALTNFMVNAGNPSYASSGGLLFSKSLTTLIQCPAGRTGSYTLPNSATSIGGYAFSGCSGLTSVTLGNSVTSIGGYAFDGCFGLTSVVIGNSVTSIGDEAFGWCSGLKNVTIPNSVSSIGNWAFGECYGLTNVVIGSSVTSIGSKAFYYCSALHQVYFQGNAPGMGSADSTIFQGELGTVYYQPGTTGWGDTFGGWPTAQWYLPNPKLLNDPTLGVQSNKFGFTISWATNVSVVVEARSSLYSGTWTPIATNSINNGSLYFADPNWNSYPERYYRVRTP